MFKKYLLNKGTNECGLENVILGVRRSQYGTLMIQEVFPLTVTPSLLPVISGSAHGSAISLCLGTSPLMLLHSHHLKGLLLPQLREPFLGSAILPIGATSGMRQAPLIPWHLSQCPEAQNQSTGLAQDQTLLHLSHFPVTPFFFPLQANKFLQFPSARAKVLHSTSANGYLQRPPSSQISAVQGQASHLSLNHFVIVSEITGAPWPVSGSAK